jgi:hypothetical protein
MTGSWLSRARRKDAGDFGVREVGAAIATAAIPLEIGERIDCQPMFKSDAEQRPQVSEMIGQRFQSSAVSDEILIFFKDCVDLGLSRIAVIAAHREGDLHHIVMREVLRFEPVGETLYFILHVTARFRTLPFPLLGFAHPSVDDFLEADRLGCDPLPGRFAENLVHSSIELRQHRNGAAPDYLFKAQIVDFGQFAVDGGPPPRFVDHPQEPRCPFGVFAVGMNSLGQVLVAGIRRAEMAERHPEQRSVPADMMT